MQCIARQPNALLLAFCWEFPHSPVPCVCPSAALMDARGDARQA